MKKYLKKLRMDYIAWVLILIGVFLILVFSLLKPFNDWSFVIDSSVASQLGDFIGGYIGSLFSLAGVLLLIETLREQRKMIAEQKAQFSQLQFENKYFELLKTYREMVLEMAHRVPQYEDKTEYGRRVFLEIRNQFKMIYEIVKTENSKEKVFTEPDTVDIAYLILYFGMSKDYQNDLDSYLSPYKEKGTNTLYRILAACERKPANYNGSIKYFGGHQSRLGHFCHFLLVILKFASDDLTLKAEAKVHYIEILLAQISVYELALLLLHANSSLGKNWLDFFRDNQVVSSSQFFRYIEKDLLCGITSEILLSSLHVDSANQLNNGKGQINTP